MANDQNLVLLTGRVCHIKINQSGTHARVAVYSKSYRRDKQTRDWTEYTERHTICLFEPHIDYLRKHVPVNSFVRIEGALRTRTYTPDDGIQRFETQIVASVFACLIKGKTADERTNDSEASSNPPSGQSSAPQPAPDYNSGFQGFDDFDNDISF